MTDKCKDCNAIRPRWHGGPHACLKLGERYYIAHQASRLITEGELEFLGISDRTSL